MVNLDLLSGLNNPANTVKKGVEDLKKQNISKGKNKVTLPVVNGDPYNFMDSINKAGYNQVGKSVGQMKQGQTTTQVLGVPKLGGIKSPVPQKQVVTDEQLKQLGQNDINRRKKENADRQARTIGKLTAPRETKMELVVNDNLIKDLSTDLGKGATVDEIKQLYPELKNNDNLIKDLSTDLGKGATVDEIKQLYPELSTSQPAKDQGFFENMRNTTKQDYKVKEGVIPTKDKGFMNNLVGGAVTEVPNVIGNIGNVLSTITSTVPAGLGEISGRIGETFGVQKENNPFYTSGMKSSENLYNLGDTSRNIGQTVKQAWQEQSGVNPESFTTKTGEMITDIAVPLPKVGLVDKLGKVGVIAKGSKILPKTSKYLVKPAIEGVEQGINYDLASKGKVTTQTAEDFALGNIALKGAGKFVGLTRNYLTKTVPEQLIASGLMNPADFRNAAERLSKLTGKEVDPADASNWLLEKLKNGGDKKNIRDQIKNATEQSQKEASDLLKTNTEIHSNDVTYQLRKALYEKLKTMGKFNKDGTFNASSGLENVSDDMLKLISKDGLTLEEINNGRKILSKDLFTKGGTMKDVSTKEGWQNVWKNSSQYIEEQIPGFRKINKDIEVGIAVDKAISKKEARDLTNQILGGAGIGGLLGGASSGGDPIEALKGALSGAVIMKGKNILTSTTVKSKLAIFLNKFKPAERKIVEDFIKTGNVTEEVKDIIGNVPKERSLTITKKNDYNNNTSNNPNITPKLGVVNTLPAEGQSSYKKPAIITPQTKESGVILESKKGLENTKFGNNKTNIKMRKSKTTITKIG